MTRTRRFGWTLAALALWPLAAQAQVVIRRSVGGGSAGMQWLEVAPTAYGVTAWNAGQWARYSVSENMGGGMPMMP